MYDGGDDAFPSDGGKCAFPFVACGENTFPLDGGEYAFLVLPGNGRHAKVPFPHACKELDFGWQNISLPQRMIEIG